MKGMFDRFKALTEHERRLGQLAISLIQHADDTAASFSMSRRYTRFSNLKFSELQDYERQTIDPLAYAAEYVFNKKRTEDWWQFSERVFGLTVGGGDKDIDRAFKWLFDERWAYIDDSVEGFVWRVRRFLGAGVPDGFHRPPPNGFAVPYAYNAATAGKSRGGACR